MIFHQQIIKLQNYECLGSLANQLTNLVGMSKYDSNVYDGSSNNQDDHEMTKTRNFSVKIPLTLPYQNHTHTHTYIYIYMTE